MVWLINVIANGLLRLLRVDPGHVHHDMLSVEELRTLVKEATSKIALNYRNILLRVLDLDKVTVEDVMVPQAETEKLS